MLKVLTLILLAMLFLLAWNLSSNFPDRRKFQLLFSALDEQTYGTDSGSYYKSMDEKRNFTTIYDWTHSVLKFMQGREMGDLQLSCNNSSDFLRAHLLGLPIPTIQCGRHTTYIAQEACDIASNYNQILLFGDSLCRHVAMALLSILRGNLHTGATKEWEVPPESKCFGEMQYTEYECRRYCLVNSFRLAGSENASRAFCPGRRVYTRFLEWWQIKDLQTFFGTADENEYLRLDRIEPYSAIIIYPPGLHADMRNPGHMLSNYVQPIVDAAQRVPSTVVVIIGIHSMAPNMPPQYAARQSEEVIVPFNRALQQYAEARGLGYLDTYNLTKGSFSSDGVHYGAEANLLKAQLLLNYLDLYRRENPGVYNHSQR